jgi:hypothetical protein
VTSTPVVITIDAGLPAQAFFTLGPAFYNFAAWDWIGRNDPITVLVGDKYSNPVKKSTAVYFNTTGGVIDASGFTNPDGFASVNLWSGNPLPKDATLNNPALYGDGTGYGHVVAHTLGENGVQVLDTIMVLFSAHSEVGLSTHTIHVPASGCVDVALTISDRFGNPLSAGTQIAVQTTFTPPEGTNWSIIVSGVPTDPLPDVITRGPGITDYILHICDGTPGGTPQDMPFSVKVSVTGQNGNAFDIVTGVVGP